MIRGGRDGWGWYILALALATVTGCRDVAPPPTYNRDLGDGTVLLPPVRSARQDAELRDGTAEWHKFSKFEAVEEETAEAEVGEEEAGEVEAEIRELIAEYNEFVAERDLDEFLEYHVEEQHETVKALFEADAAMMGKFAGLRSLLDEKLPEKRDRVATVFDRLEAKSKEGLVVESLTVVSDVEVTGKLAPGGPAPTCRFLVVDDEWYLEIPELPDPVQLKPALDMVMATLDTLAQGLESGQLLPEQVLGQVETIVQTINGGAPGPGNDTETEEEG